MSAASPDERRAAHLLLDALRRGHDVPTDDVNAALMLTGDIPEVGEDEADTYNALRCREVLGGFNPKETDPCQPN